LAALERAAIALDALGLSEKDLTTNDMFVKLEAKLANWFSRVFKSVKPRVIISCLAQVKVALGPYIVAYTQQLHEDWDVLDPITLGCGRVQTELATWFNRSVNDFGPARFFDDDMTLFDRTESDLSLQFCTDCMAARGCHGLPLRCLRSQQKRQTIRTRNGLRVNVPAFMRSGVPNTTLTNSITNAAVHYFALTTICGFVLGRDYRMIVCGDDFMGAGIQAVHDALPLVERVLRDLGFLPKLKGNLIAENVRFLSMAFYPVAEGGYAPAPTVKCLFKLNVTKNRLPTGTEAQHRRGVALGLLPLVNHVPILRDAIQRELRDTVGAHGHVLNRAKHEMRVKYPLGATYHETPASDSYVAHMYDVSVDTIAYMRRFTLDMHANGFYSSTRALEFVTRSLEVETG